MIVVHVIGVVVVVTAAADWREGATVRIVLLHLVLLVVQWMVQMMCGPFVIWLCDFQVQRMGQWRSDCGGCGRRRCVRWGW